MENKELNKQITHQNSQFSILNSPLLYIHIPFCDSKCNYCAFNSYTNLNHLKKDYFNAIKKQFLHDIEKFKIKKFETVFIGGGTPSTMPISFYEKLFKLLEPFLKNTKEITIESNPNTSYEWLKEIKNLGVNRISFGVQSFNDKKLKFLNRNHSSKLAIETIENAKKANFENINIDIIYATEMDNYELLKNDLKIIGSLPITHISAYSLMIEKNTKWEGDFSKRKEDEELEIWFIDEIRKRFNQYEISNFGKPCLHNLGYWKHKEYIGIGAGAVGFIKSEKCKVKNEKFRYYTQNDVYKYLKNPTHYEYEYLSKDDLKKEKVLLGLRSIVGFEEKILNKEEKKRAEVLIKEKKLFKKEEKIYSTDFLLADALSAYIID